MAWTTARTWTDGELVTAAIMNPHVRDNLNAVSWHLLARKSADTSRTNNTLSDDPHLTWAIAANEHWMVKLGLWAESASGTPDLKPAITVPAGGVFTLSTVALSGGTLSRLLLNTSGTGVQVDLGAAVREFYEFTGIIENAGTAGNVVCQWAQFTTDATATILQANSYFVGSKLA